MYAILRSFVWMKWLVLGCLFASCGSGKGSGLTPTSTGRPYELLVVADSSFWGRPAGRALFEVLDTDLPGLPQAERAFRLMYASPHHFDAILKLVRNIVVVQVDSVCCTRASLAYAEDVYAFPQAILFLRAPDEASFVHLVKQRRADILDCFTEAERKRRMAWLAENHNRKMDQLAKEMFGCSVWLPAELASYKVGKDFLWAGSNGALVDENFVLYAFPYEDTRVFTKSGFIHKRDSVMKVNIPGAREGMYMTTDSLLTDIRPITVQGKPVWEARGLWHVQGDFMGGPFVSHLQVDEANRRVVVSEIFVYAPGRSKRNLVRQLETSLYTLRLPQTEQTDTIGIKNNY